MLDTQQLLDFLKTGMTSAQTVSDELIRQFTNYLLVALILKIVTVAAVFGFIYSSMGKGIKLLAEDKVSQGWAAGLKSLRVIVVAGSIVYSYHSISSVLEPLMAPHVWLLKQGIEVIKK